MGLNLCVADSLRIRGTRGRYKQDIERWTSDPSTGISPQANEWTRTLLSQKATTSSLSTNSCSSASVHAFVLAYVLSLFDSSASVTDMDLDICMDVCTDTCIAPCKDIYAVMCVRGCVDIST